ncbi:TonB-dependent receptor [Rheinheimera marina]|uniref:TonB-dependent receptor n=1 Tax=Rheinheimera marina TaxID=1774958 RepID=A0ABV9JP14_9GAMM
MSHNSSRARTPVCLAVSLALASGLVQAQQSDEGIEVIEVTAQKRAENMQEVPIAITAFSADTIDKMGLKNINDLGLITPGLETNNATATQTSFNIRGISTNDFGIGLDAAVAVYIDGVYVGRRGTSNLNFNDVERVEVLKGPQGTLFGRNSAAGAIHIITKAASADPEGQFKATLGSHGKHKMEFSGTTALGDNLNGRISLNRNKRDGYLDVKDSDEKYGNQNDWAVRGSLEWAWERAELILRADYSDIDQQARPAVTLNTTFGSGDPFGPIEYDFEGHETREAGGLSAELNYDLGDNMSFTSISAYRQFERGNAMEDDGSAYASAYFVSNLIEDQSQFSQEFRLSQNTDNFKWTFGTNWYKEDIDQTTQATFNTLTFDSLAVVQMGLDPRIVLPMGTGVAGAYMTMGTAKAQQAVATEIGRLMMQGLTFAQAQASVANTLINANLTKVLGQHMEQFDNNGVTESVALYFDGTYALTDKLDLTLGGRLTYDVKDFYLHSEPQNFFTVPFGGVGQVPLAVAFIPQSAQQEADWSKFTPRAVLDYQWTPQLMTYISYAEGFKAGGFNTLGEAPPVKEETVQNTEIGMKSSWLDNRLRLNLSLYQYDYTNLQQLELVGPPGGVPTYNLRNVDAEGNGYEAEVIWQATPDLRLTANYGHVETEYTKWQYFDWESSGSKVGQAISGMPENQASVWLDYYFAGLSGQFNLHLSYAYTGDRTQGVDGPKLAVLPFEQGSVTGLNDDALNSIKGYGLLDGRLSWQSDNHPFSLSFYVHNALDKEYIIQTGGQAMAVGSPIATPGLPRMYGVEFGMTF